MAEIDREKTIEGLKRYLNYPKPLCDAAQQAITLLKEQEAKPELPVDIRPANERFATMKLGYCPKCGKKINSVDHKNYCGECSQAVKWDQK